MANAIFGFKPGDTFSYSGIVSSLPSSTDWQAAATVRGADGTQFAVLDVTLAEASDYATTGNLTITLFASSTATGGWGRGGAAPRCLYCDIKFSATAGADPVVHSETFKINLEAPIT